MENDTTETLGQRLARLRVAAKWTQAELAEKAGVATGSIRNWEQDHRRPRADAALRLARALGVTVEELLVLPSSRPARADVKDGPELRALKRAWGRADQRQRERFLNFIGEEGKGDGVGSKPVAKKGSAAASEKSRKTPKQK